MPSIWVERDSLTERLREREQSRVERGAGKLRDRAEQRKKKKKKKKRGERRPNKKFIQVAIITL
jgi:hypothetical protein